MEYKEKLAHHTGKIAKELGCKYTLKGQTIEYSEVFSPSGMMPALLRRADQLANFTLGYGLGVSFERQDGTLLGYISKIEDSTPTALRLLCITDVLVEIMQNAPSNDKIPLDELMLD